MRREPVRRVLGLILLVGLPCRAGTDSRFSFGNDPAYKEIDGYAWHSGNAVGRPQSVGGKLPNAWGLYDMHGNAAEWCRDWFGEKYYAENPETDPPGPATGKTRVLRGGSWLDPAPKLRSAARGHVEPDFAHKANGFRICVPATKLAKWGWKG